MEESKKISPRLSPKSPKKTTPTLELPIQFSEYKYLENLGNTDIKFDHRVEYKNKIYRIKEFSWDREFGILSEFLIEADILSRIKHPNIVEAKKIYEDNDRDSYMIITEYPSQSKLNDRYIVNSEGNCLKLLIDLLYAIEYIHSHDIIHGNISWNNVFNFDGVAKLGDFGSAQKDIPDGKFEINPKYAISPEEYEKKDFSKSVDIWAFGAIVYAMLFDRFFFIDHDVREIYAYLSYLDESKHEKSSIPEKYKKIKGTGVLGTVNKDRIEEAKEKVGKDYDLIIALCQCCLRINPEDRPTARYLLDTLSSVESPKGTYLTVLPLSKSPIDEKTQNEIFIWLEKASSEEFSIQDSTLILSLDLFWRYMDKYNEKMDSKELKKIMSGCLSIAAKICEHFEEVSSIRRIFGFGPIEYEPKIVESLGFVLYPDNIETVCKREPDSTYDFVKRIMGDRESDLYKKFRNRQFSELCKDI